jgi:mRNA interferase MazF
MAGILRGEVRWADLNPVRGHEQAGIRPVLILSNDVFNQRTGMVIAVAITSKQPKTGFPLSMEIKTPAMPVQSWVIINQIRTISTERVGSLLGKTSLEELIQVLEGLNEIIT